jgi:hypothetical protein
MVTGAFPQAQACPAMHGVHAAAQELQVPLAQSDTCVHRRPSSHLGQSGPPQSMSDSVPSFLWLLHVPPLLVPPLPPLAVVLPPVPVMVLPPLAVVCPPVLVVLVPPLAIVVPPVPVALVPPLAAVVPPVPVVLVPPLAAVVPPVPVVLVPPLPETPPAPGPPSMAPGSWSGFVPTQTLSRHACPTMRQGSEIGLHAVRHWPAEHSVPSGHGILASPLPQAAAAGSTHAAPRLVCKQRSPGSQSVSERHAARHAPSRHTPPSPQFDG